MSKENLICKGNRVLTDKGRDNWDRIFKDKKKGKEREK